jgi:protocatechuate 3,4-dioxygenase beta subunit
LEAAMSVNSGRAPQQMSALSRRALIQALGAAAVATPLTSSTGCEEAGACSELEELTEGPYYLPGPEDRADITEGLEGAPMTMRIQVLDTACQPLAGAVVDVWHAAPDGSYSGVGEAEGEMYLRGVQTTDQDGIATFQTVVPGWYQGRTTHVHFKVSVDNSEVLTSQAFFPEDLLSEIYASGAYASRGDKDTANDDDDIFAEADDDRAVFAMETGEGGAYTGTLAVHVAT